MVNLIYRTYFRNKYMQSLSKGKPYTQSQCTQDARLIYFELFAKKNLTSKISGANIKDVNNK